MYKRFLACLLCLWMTTALSTAVHAAETQTVRIEDVGVTIQLPQDYDCLSIDLPADHSIWNKYDRAEFLRSCEEFGTYLSSYSSDNILFDAATQESWLPDFDLMTEEAILNRCEEYQILDQMELTADPEIFRTENAVYYVLSFNWTSDDGTTSTFKQYLTSRNGLIHEFSVCSNDPLTEQQEQELREIISTLTIDKDTFEGGDTHDTIVQDPGFSMRFPVAYSYKNPELPADDLCWVNWNKRDFMEWVGDSSLHLYADDGYSEMQLYVADDQPDYSWSGYSDGAVIYEGKNLLLSVNHSYIYSEMTVYHHDQTPFLSMLYEDTEGNPVRCYLTFYGGRQYIVYFTSFEPLSSALDEEYRSIMDSLRFLPSALLPPSEQTLSSEEYTLPPEEHTISLSDDPVTDPTTGMTFLVPNRWRYTDGDPIKNSGSFHLSPEWDYASDYLDLPPTIYCFRFDQMDLPYLDGETDPLEIAAALISRHHEETVTADMLDWRKFKGSEYHIYRPETLGEMEYTDLMVHVRDGQVYLFATTAPLDSPFHEDFLAMMGTVEFGEFTMPEPEEPEQAEEPKTNSFQTILLWLVGIALAVLVGIVIFLVIVLRKPKAAPTQSLTQKEEASLPDISTPTEEPSIPDVPAPTEEASIPDVPTPTEEAPPPEIPVPPAVTGNANFCPYCGKKLHSENLFCTNCGRRVRD